MLVGVFAAISALLSASATPPDRIDPGALGAPKFHELFRSLRVCDPQVDRSCKGRHWRSDFGYAGGDPTAFANRNGADAAYVDPAFPGVLSGRLQTTALGLSPFELTPDYLKITATPTPERDKPLLWNKPFVSGLLSSIDMFRFTYGYVEVAADLPLCVRGAWPAIWTSVNDGWPTGGELDFPEDVGAGQHWFSMHDASNEKSGVAHQIFTPPTGCERGFHRYGALKTPTWVAYYYDGRKVAQFPAGPDMRRPHCIILDLAMGGGWASSASGPPDRTKATSMLVKSVDAWTADGG